jgi:hypothetical protein
MLFDYHDDTTSAVLTRHIHDHGESAIPEFVKAAAEAPGEATRAEKTLYAWPKLKKFACDTAADTWLAAFYFTKTASQIGNVDDRNFVRDQIKYAAAIHGVEDIILPMLEEPVQKAASEAPVMTEVQAAYASAHSFRPNELPLEEVHKTAAVLDEVLTEANIPVPAIVKQAAQAVKRSHVIDSVRQRVAIIRQNHDEAAHLDGLRKAASARNVDLPHAYRPVHRFDDGFMTAYNELCKLAHDEELGAEFWDAYATLDKLAGFDQAVGLIGLPAIAYRPVDEDMYPANVKLAGVHMALQDIVHGIPDHVLADIAPGAFAVRGNMRKFAAALAELELPQQRMLLVSARAPHA